MPPLRALRPLVHTVLGIAVGSAVAVAACDNGGNRASPASGQDASMSDGASGSDAPAPPPPCTETVDHRIAQYISASGELAPAVGGQYDQPQAISWMSDGTDHIYSKILALSNITPCDTDPLDPALVQSAGFLEQIEGSLVVNKGGSRATFLYYVKSPTALGHLWTTILFSYDRVVPDGGPPICASEVFIFAGSNVRECGPPNEVLAGNPPQLMEGLAVDARGCLLSEVPIELAHVSRYPGPFNDGASHTNSTETVKPGVQTNGFGCLLCHAHVDDQEPEHTKPFPWVQDDASCPDAGQDAAPEAGPDADASGPPEVYAVYPNIGLPGTQIRVLGYNLGGPGTTVLFNDATALYSYTVPAIAAANSTDTTLYVTVPAQARSGFIAIGNANNAASTGFTVGGTLNATFTETGCDSDAGFCVWDARGPMAFGMNPQPMGFTIHLYNFWSDLIVGGTYNDDGSYTAAAYGDSGGANTVYYSFAGQIGLGGGSGTLTVTDSYSAWTGHATGTYTTDPCVALGQTCTACGTDNGAGCCSSQGKGPSGSATCCSAPQMDCQADSDCCAALGPAQCASQRCCTLAGGGCFMDNDCCAGLKCSPMEKCQ